MLIVVCRHRLSTIMNADRIVVVEGGEIEEEGSHDELIVAKGRYADLWSKQTFIKPKNTEGKTDASSAANPTIINDLTPECTTTEVSKAQAATGEATQKQPTENGAAKTPNGHKKEVESAEESSASSADSNL
jgi:ABC-type multidrug transport system ATPase subunit